MNRYNIQPPIQSMIKKPARLDKLFFHIPTVFLSLVLEFMLVPLKQFPYPQLQGIILDATRLDKRFSAKTLTELAEKYN